jgi:hypothetical protein
MKIPQPTLNEMNSKHPFHMLGKLGTNGSWEEIMPKEVFFLGGGP